MKKENKYLIVFSSFYKITDFFFLFRVQSHSDQRSREKLLVTDILQKYSPADNS